MLIIVTGDKKNEILEMMIEECKMGNAETRKKNLHGLFFKSASEHASTKNTLIKMMPPNVNEVCSDEEDIKQEEDEELDYDKEVVQTDGEGNANPLGSIKDIIEIFLQVDESLVHRNPLSCKKIKTREGNALKLATD